MSSNVLTTFASATSTCTHPSLWSSPFLFVCTHFPLHCVVASRAFLDLLQILSVQGFTLRSIRVLCRIVLCRLVTVVKVTFVAQKPLSSVGFGNSALFPSLCTLFSHTRQPYTLLASVNWGNCLDPLPLPNPFLTHDFTLLPTVVVNTHPLPQSRYSRCRRNPLLWYAYPLAPIPNDKGCTLLRPLASIKLYG
ncbi:hypothetical protein BN1708_009546, partial [Verticillium longisporum]